MRGIYTAALLDKVTSYYARLRNEEALDIGKERSPAHAESG
jgi:hypothetical protein